MPDPVHSPPHHTRIRRVKRLLRFTPRRAVFHTYPVIGRFAAFARKRAYLWSFKTAHVRPAFYAGSILSFLPVMGVQLPLALILALVLRSNFMVMGGLQFITNPFTAAPIYYATYKLGERVIAATGIDTTIVPPPRVSSAETLPAGPRPPPELDSARVDLPGREPRLGRRLGATVNALIIGGVLTGSVVGLGLDLVHRFLHRPLPPRRPSASTDPARPPE